VRVFISGLYSGPNPSPGLGTARSLRLAYPNATLVGVDYSPRSTGLHHEVFDDLWVRRPWTELDLDRYAQRIADELADDGYWISGLDLEAAWLSKSLASARLHFLGPPPCGLDAIAKPAAALAERLGLNLPPTISVLEGDWALHRFCRRHGWNVWLKGPQYQAIKVRSWQAFLQARTALLQTWNNDAIHVQAHVAGIEESVIFAAWQGDVTGMAHMAKRLVTDEGKTWAGRISRVDEALPGFAESLLQTARDIEWSGGAELEMIRAPDGCLYLLECNPRFPAWVHGATIAGINVPASLLAAASGRQPQPCKQDSAEFARIVIEVPVRPSYGLPPPTVGTDGGVVVGKHPSGMPELSRRLTSASVSVDASPRLSEHEEHEIHELMRGLAVTPAPLLLHRSTEVRWARLADVVANLGRSGPEIRLAYSIKTNPDARLLQLARSAGFSAEAISRFEFERALKTGWSPAEVILNGPAKDWPTAAPCPVLAEFADSPQELRRLVTRATSKYVGPRLRLPEIPSRFGIRVGEWDEYEETVEILRVLEPPRRLALHFHHASSDLGWTRWREAAKAVVEFGAALEIATGVPVACIDLGGGWHPEDWEALLEETLREVLACASHLLRSLDLVILEPGKALTQPAFVVATRVLEVRENEAVVDCSIAELADSWSHPHRVLSARTTAATSTESSWRPLPAGRGRLIGRLCMERDVIATGLAVGNLEPGQLLAIADAGAYDQSMSYEFGRG
jgi:diaminopimelate decarboxylase